MKKVFVLILMMLICVTANAVGVTGETRDANGDPLEGVIMTYSGTSLGSKLIDTSASDGYYSLQINAPWTGMIVGTKDCYDIPHSSWYTDETDNITFSPTCTIKNYGVGGFITPPLRNVQMSFTGTFDRTVYTDTLGYGNYGTRFDCGWEGTLTPIFEGYSFSPQSIDITVEDYMNNLDFSATDTSMPTMAPALVSPTNLEVVATDGDLVWNQVPKALSYGILVSTESDLSTPLVDDTISDTMTTAALSNSTTYYWSVRGINASGVGPWSDTLALQTLPPLPGLVTITSPDDGAVNVATNVPLIWEAESVADEYTIEIAEDASFTTSVTVYGSLTELTYTGLALDNDFTYHWRIKATNASGDGSWTSHSFTTIVAVPNAPVLTTPSDNHTDQDTSVTLVWGTVAEADSYQVQLATVNDFATTVQDVYVVGTDVTLSIDFETVYYWRVAAINMRDTVWSSVRQFTTVDTPIPLPGNVTLTTPADLATQVALNASLEWESALAADEYLVQVSSASDFSDTLEEATQTTVTYSPSLTYETTYHWRVRSQNVTGNSNWSSRQFTSVDTPIPLPGDVTLTTPIDSSSVELGTSLVWESASDADEYQIQVSTDDFSSSQVDSTLTELTLTLALVYETTYQWRVRSVNVTGNSGWSSRVFATVDTPIQLPGDVTLTTPPDLATQVALDASLEWELVSAADEYQIQVSTESDFSSNQIDSTLTDLSLSSTLVYETTYHWRVRAVNVTGNSNWSSREFTTVDAPIPLPGNVTLTTPADGVTQVTLNASLVWELASDANEYLIQVSSSSDFSDTLEEATQTELTYSPTLVNGTAYYWRVRSQNATGNSSWSSGQFTTIISLPDVVIAHQLDTVEVDSLVVSWGAGTPAIIGYRFHFTGEDVTIDTIIADTQFTINGLHNGVYDYWVDAENEAGWTSGDSLQVVVNIPIVSVQNQIRLPQAVSMQLIGDVAQFALPEASWVGLVVYDLRGRLVESYRKQMTAGNHQVRITLRPGQYIASLSVGSLHSTHRINTL